MATGLSPKLPLMTDSTDGYALNKKYSEMISQNLKMLVLTSPGERIMDPEFGVGIRNFLFEQNIEVTHAEIVNRIKTQVGRYMPFVNVKAVLLTPDDDDAMDPNYLSIKLEYYIKPLRAYDILNISLKDTI
jgi:phage baseplate assembly protein W